MKDRNMLFYPHTIVCLFVSLFYTSNGVYLQKFHRLYNDVSQDLLSHLKARYCSPFNGPPYLLCQLSQNFLNQSDFESAFQLYKT